MQAPNYNFVKTLGSGAFGYVFEVINRNNGKRLALKRIEKVGKGMSRENQMLLLLKGCPNIIQLEDLFYTQNQNKKLVQNIVFQYAQTNLEKIIRTHSKKKTYLSSQKLKLYSYQILNGMKHAHAKLVAHRDLKPENVLLTQKTQKGEVKICDFGCAKVIDVKGKNTPYVGTMYYRAPELLMGIVNYTTAIDIWSIGCIIAEMALLQVFFVGENDGDQLFAILKIMGSMTKQQEKIYKKRVPFEASMMNEFRNYQRINLQQKFSHVEGSELFIDLLLKMLAYVPQRRITADQAMKHPYFSNLREELMAVQEDQ